MEFYEIDPILDTRWAELVDKHPNASVFHTVAWLKALQTTYGYEPVGFTTSPPNSDLKNGLVFCRIESWLTGRRLVSLPFSDHCEPICDSAQELRFLIQHIEAALERESRKYLEMRPVVWDFSQMGDRTGLRPIATYFRHTLDLTPDLNEVFRSFDKDSVQRRIHRAQRAGLVERCGASQDLLKDFYGLFVMTRRRHCVPPTPRSWFSNLSHFQGEALEIRVAYYGEKPIAAILTLRFRHIIFYKYGCSDTRFNKFGAIPWLLWRAIEEGTSKGAMKLDLGRTEKENTGLLEFKNHWAPFAKPLVYWRLPEKSSPLDSADGWKMRMAKRAFSHMPLELLVLTGRLLYRHFG